MRVALAVTALALAFAPAVMANNPPLAAQHTTPLAGLHVIKLGKGTQAIGRLRSCLANQLSERTAAGRAARRFAPVACEQPPRSEQLAIIALAGP